MTRVIILLNLSFLLILCFEQMYGMGQIDRLQCLMLTSRDGRIISDMTHRRNKIIRLLAELTESFFVETIPDVNKAI